MELTPNQRHVIRTFCELTQTSEPIATAFLFRFDYRIEEAVENYFQNPHLFTDSRGNDKARGLVESLHQTIDNWIGARTDNQEENMDESKQSSSRHSIDHSLDGPSTRGRSRTRSVSVPPPPTKLPPRSASPDYWAMADEHARGSKEWLRTMILSVLNAYTTVSEEDRTLKMVTIAHLSSLLRSFDEGKRCTKMDNYADTIDILGYRDDISWLDFLREMRDEGLIRMHAVDSGYLKDYALYAPHNANVSPMVDEKEFID